MCPPVCWLRVKLMGAARYFPASVGVLQSWGLPMGVHQGRAWQLGPSHHLSQVELTPGELGDPWAATAPGIRHCPGAEAGPRALRWARLSRAHGRAGPGCEEAEVTEARGPRP